MYTPKHLRRWTLPNNYVGAKWPAHYSSSFGRSQASDPIEESNFQVAWATLKSLGAERVRESHWAVGWIEWIAIHETNTEALRAADEMREAVDNYPILNENHFSELESELANEAWQHTPLRERIELCADDGLSIFAARHDYRPRGDTGRIQERLLGY